MSEYFQLASRSGVGELAVTNQLSAHAGVLRRPDRRSEASQDCALLELARGGDRQAFHHLVERYQRPAFIRAFGLVRDENDAREIVQEAFLRVHLGLGAFQRGSSFFTWLYHIVTNLCIDLMRRPWRRATELHGGRRLLDRSNVPLVARLDDMDPTEGMRRIEIRECLQVALNMLTSCQRRVILMREVQGMSYDEIAVAMQVPPGTVMSRLFHARKKLRRALAHCYLEQIGRHAPSEARSGVGHAEGPV